MSTQGSVSFERGWGVGSETERTDPTRGGTVVHCTRKNLGVQSQTKEYLWKSNDYLRFYPRSVSDKIKEVSGKMIDSLEQ